MEHEIDVNELAERMRGGATVIDVREPAEYAEAHIAGTRLIPMRELDRRVDDLDGTQPVYLVCRTGNRSGVMRQVLASAGLPAVNVRGGVEAWAASGRPMQEGLS